MPGRSGIVSQVRANPVLVVRCVDGGDPARAVRVGERVFDLIRRNAERRGLVAVDLDRDLWVLDLQRTRHVLQLGKARSFPRAPASSRYNSSRSGFAT